MPKGRSLPDHATILLLTHYNPKRINFGRARWRFAQYRDGMIVGEYRAIIGPRYGINRADDDLRHDQQQGYIYVDENAPDERVLI